MILLVDDEAAVRRVLAQHLSDAGFDVSVAASGTDALALAAAETLDGLITGLSVPEMDGLTVIRGQHRLVRRSADRLRGG